MAQPFLVILLALEHAKTGETNLAIEFHRLAFEET
jgi:hypothetical protein